MNSDNDTTCRAARGAFNVVGRSSNLESAVLDVQRWRGSAGDDAVDNVIVPAHGMPRGRAQPRGRRQQGRRYGGCRAVVRGLRERVAMLLAASQIGLSRFRAVRHVGGRRHCHCAACFGRARVRRHCDLLEQQAEERNERDPAAVAVTTQWHKLKNFPTRWLVASG